MLMIYSLIFTSITLQRYWIFLQSQDISDGLDGRNFTDDNDKNETLYCYQQDVVFIKTYLIAVVSIVALNLPILLAMISISAKGTICDVQARKHVSTLLYFK